MQSGLRDLWTCLSSGLDAVQDNLIGCYNARTFADVRPTNIAGSVKGDRDGQMGPSFIQLVGYGGR
jgi:hypothetical protein